MRATGSIISLTTKASGAGVNYAMTLTTQSTSSPAFNPPSFTASTSGPALTGGTGGYGFALLYAPNGNLLAANDSANGNWTYTYDDFNRLTGSACSLHCPDGQNTQGFSYVYDRYANRWQQNVTAGSGYTSSLSFSGNNNRMDGYSYDASGNLLNDGTHQYYYDAESQLIQVDGTFGNCSSATACYVYDADGKRVQKTTSAGSVDYIYDIAGNQVAEINSSGALNRGEVYAGGRHLATYAGGMTYFDHADWLGTERARSGISGAVCETIASLAFGDGQTTSGGCGDASPMHFTGKERDNESGLDNFGARYDSSNIGRFMSPDPLLNSGQPWNPQSWNRYAYTENNPLRYTDPTGLYKFGDCSGTAEECLDQEQRFRDSIEEARDALAKLDPASKEAKALKATLDKLGDEDEGDITINFGYAGKSKNGPNLGRTLGHNITINYEAVDQVAKDYSLTASEKDALDAGVTTHEGTHALGNGLRGLFQSHFEHPAYFVESATYQGLHNTDKAFGLWNESWITVDKDKLSVEQHRENAIQNAIHPPKQQKQENPK